MKSARILMAGLLAAGLFLVAPHITCAEDTDTIADTRDVPEDIYTWVQSTDRANYYFNHQQINYAVSEDGFIDLNTLIVPTVCMYDEIQIEDVVSKRRWKMQSVKGYDKLVGRADYLTFKLDEGTVQVTERVELDERWGTLSSDKSGQPVKLSDLKTNSVECKFYRSILTWAKKHNAQIISHSWGQLTPEDSKLEPEDMPLLKLKLLSE